MVAEKEKLMIELKKETSEKQNEQNLEQTNE